jgi:hypothetical protein
MTKPLFEEVLDDAVTTRFCKLLEVLMLDPSPENLKRFRMARKARGLTRRLRPTKNSTPAAVVAKRKPRRRTGRRG